jgi:hypothetical protein
MIDYPALHVDTNKSKGTACSKNVYDCKWTRYTIHHTYAQMKVKEQLEVRKDIDVNEHDRLSITPIHKWKERNRLK